jgi:hypothetical protein
MWCPNCKADVAAEVAADNRRVRCATCGVEISASAAFTGLAKTREARDLLERWASERRVDSAPIEERSADLRSRSERRAQRTATADSTIAGGISLEDEIAATAAGSRLERGTAAIPQAESERPLRGGYRIDPSQAVPAPSAPTRRARSERTVPRQEQIGSRQDSARLHRQHEASDSPPHFNIQSSILGSERKRTNWTAIIGQLIAYAGVALLTIGTTLIVWSYFGGPANYAPTGWLTTTAGQMLLFLGVVTLVSGGMEQTSEDVRTRIERLGERIIRIEQIAREQALHGPYIPAEYYETGAPPQGTESSRHTADSRG